ncbi:hypothetical protein IQ06DRAFT_288957 [Phaeosphaeriaceae sp. SRC1lsM3a]|nr:hypothetical protein IQ06DRAFT_288957 [Stagonospora sp. SRC1lsM3a]
MPNTSAPSMACAYSHSRNSDVLHQPSPRRPKRALSELLEDDPPGCDPSHPAKQACRRSDAFILSWLRTQQCRSCEVTPRSFVTPQPRSKSAPEPSPSMPLPTPPSSTISKQSDNTSSKSTSTATPKTSDALYRIQNLGNNGIWLRKPTEDLPARLQSILCRVRQPRTSPPPDLPDPSDLEMGTDESTTEAYFKDNLLRPRFGPVRRDEKLLMEKSTVPNNPNSIHRVCAPKPDAYYGYDRYTAFPQSQQIFLGNITHMSANTNDLIYPFFFIEIKADGPQSSCSLWTATNQCLGGASASIKMIETLDNHVRECAGAELLQLNNVAFSIAMSGTEGRLYISWKGDDGEYFTQKVSDYLLQRPQEMLLLRQHALNIIDWGKTERLQQIQSALDAVVEADRLEIKTKAKSRAQPHDRQDTRKRRKVGTSGLQQPPTPPLWILDPSRNQFFYIGSDDQVVWQ